MFDRVNSVSPGWIWSGENKKVCPTDTRAEWETKATGAFSISKRMGEMSEVAGAVTFLFSKDAEYVNGKIYNITFKHHVSCFSCSKRLESGRRLRRHVRRGSRREVFLWRRARARGRKQGQELTLVFCIFFRLASKSVNVNTPRMTFHTSIVLTFN